MILMGKVLSVFGELDDQDATSALKKVVLAKHADMLDVNLGALKIGADYKD